MRTLTTWADRHAGRIVLALAAAVAVAGLGYSILLGDTLRYPDEVEYHTLARHLRHAGVFGFDGETPTVRRPPAYPVLLAGLLYTGGSVVHLRVVNFAALALSMLLLYGMLRARSRLAGLAAAAALAAYPLAFYTAGTLYPQTLATTLLLTALHLLFVRSGIRSRILAGLAFGTLILAVPAFVFAFAFTAGWMLLTRPRLPFSHLLALGAACALVLAPWVLRNRAVSGEWVFVASNAGVNLLLGNSEHTTPNAGVNTDISAVEEQARLIEGEVARDRFYARQAVAYIRANPGRAARLYALKFLNYFNYTNRLNTASEQTPLRDAILLLSYGLLVLASILRLALRRLVPLAALDRFALLLYALNGAYAAIFFTRVRFRLPFDTLLILVAAPLVAYGLGRLSHAPPSPAPATGPRPVRARNAS